MNIRTIQCGLFKLDGGAMFGVVPKVMWNKMNPADENNLCTWCMRSLLIEIDDRKILVDTGIGDKQDEKFRSHFHPHGPSLLESLYEAGVLVEDITDVFMTHLHFDHCGGSVSINDEGQYVPTFPNARYFVSERQYRTAIDPNPREKASFLKENFVPLMDAGVLTLLNDYAGEEWLPGIRLYSSYGHTEGMLYLDIECDGRHFIYPADVMPSAHHVGLAYVMSYDLLPLVSIDEKESMLERAVDRHDIFILEHDKDNAFLSVTKNEKGRIIAHQTASTMEEALAWS